MNGWPAGCYSTAQFEWYSYFEQLGLLPVFCAEPVQTHSKSFAAQMFVAPWVTIVFVAEEASAVNFSSLASCIASAKELASLAPIDAVVVSGSPKDSSGQIRLYNQKTLDLESSDAHFENLWFVSGLKSVKGNKLVAWCLENRDGLSYLLPSQVMRPACKCKTKKCKICKFELKRAPLWVEEPRSICEKHMKPRWETGLIINPPPGTPNTFTIH
jgi:hypothetical protein